MGKLQEAMARATPTKATNELKEKLRREEDKVFEARMSQAFAFSNWTIF